MSFINTLNEKFDAQIKWNPIAVIMFMDDFFARKVKSFSHIITIGGH